MQCPLANIRTGREIQEVVTVRFMPNKSVYGTQIVKQALGAIQVSILDHLNEHKLHNMDLQHGFSRWRTNTDFSGRHEKMARYTGKLGHSDFSGNFCIQFNTLYNFIVLSHL